MKKILISLSIIGVLGAVIIGGTMAAFYDTEVATGNVFTAGTLDLQLGDANEVFADGVTATWKSPDNWAPGKTVTSFVNLINDGNIDAGNLAVTFRNTAFTNFIAPAGDECFDGDAGNEKHEMARELIVVKWTYEPVHDDDNTDIIDLLAREGERFTNEWVQAADEIRVDDNQINLNELHQQSWRASLNLGGINAGVRSQMTMTIKFADDAPNELQGDSLTTDITFTLEQQTADQD